MHEFLGLRYMYMYIVCILASPSVYILSPSHSQIYPHDAWLTESPRQCDTAKRNTMAQNEYPILRRWDGKSKEATVWDRFYRDPELVEDDANCFVYLSGSSFERKHPA